ncbi:hypothetical protein HK096_009231, partial [Nowakowskiella sp. JEL0078]
SVESFSAFSSNSSTSGSSKKTGKMDVGSLLFSVGLGIEKGLSSIGNSIALLAKAENQEASSVNAIQQEMKTGFNGLYESLKELGKNKRSAL